MRIIDAVHQNGPAARITFETMNPNSASLFSRLPPVPTVPDLPERILQAVAAAERRRARTTFGIAFAGAFGSVIVAVAYRAAIWTEISSSSFFALLRLVASDPDVAIANVKDVALGLLETLPLGSILVALIAAFCVVGAVGFARTLWKLHRLSPLQQPIHS